MTPAALAVAAGIAGYWLGHPVRLCPARSLGRGSFLAGMGRQPLAQHRHGAGAVGRAVGGADLGGGGMSASRPRALDLFCCAGGVTKGLQRAGFHVTGVDIKRQPRYCGDAFVQADALRPPFRLDDFDFIWASPPCQAFSITNTRGYEYPDLIEATRALLADHPVTVIENVPGAPIRADIVLTGPTFDLPLIRRRHFEIKGFPAPLVLMRETAGTVSNGDLACVAGHGANRAWRKGNWSTMPADLRARLSARNCKAGWADAMGIDWMTRDEMAQAIPPAYSEFIGRCALAHLGLDVAAAS